MKKPIKKKSPFKQWLHDNNYQLWEAAAALGISRSYLYRLTKGERNPSPGLAMAIKNFTRGEICTIIHLRDKKE